MLKECSLSLLFDQGRLSLSLKSLLLKKGSLSLLLDKSSLSLLLEQGSLSLSLKPLLLPESCLSLLLPECRLPLSLCSPLLLDEGGLSLPLRSLLGAGGGVDCLDHLGPEGGEDLGGDSGLVRGGHLRDQGPEAGAGLGLHGGVDSGPDGGGQSDDDLLDQGLLLRLRDSHLGPELGDLSFAECYKNQLENTSESQTCVDLRDSMALATWVAMVGSRASMTFIATSSLLMDWVAVT